jgi:hypothetical protein
MEKVALFCNHAGPGARSQALQLRFKNGLIFFAEKMFPHLEAQDYRIQRTA